MDEIFVNTANRACSLIYSYIKKYNQGTWLLPVNVCPDVPLTFCLAGVAVEFVDIDTVTWCIDTHECLRRLRLHPKRYAGIILVRTYGYLFDSTQFVSACKAIKGTLKIIDDRCLCIPQRHPDMYDADVVLYSTGHCKQIDLGGGGLAFYKSEEPYEVDKNLAYNGTDEETIYKAAFAENERLAQVPTGWLNQTGFMPWNDYIEIIEPKVVERISYRTKLNAIYTLNLPKSIQIDSRYNDWRFNVIVPASLKREILQALFDNGLFASSHYHSVNRLFDNEHYPHSDALHSGVINLFNDINYSENMAKKSCNIITSYLATYRGGGVNLRVEKHILVCSNTIAA